MNKLMIVDDDVELAENTAALLRKQGYDVATLNTTENVVQKVTEDRPDLVILDVMFPDNPVAGFDLARQIRRSKALKALPIILLTGINQEFPMDFSGADIDPDWMPVQDFMEKPVKIPVLVEKIAQLLKTR